MDNDIKKPAEAPHYPPQTFVATPSPSDKHETPKSEYIRNHSGWHDLLSFVAIIAVAALVAFMIIAFVFRSYEVDGPSMQTTLYNNDKLIIWKVPRTWSRITGHQYVPKRGDIIIFTEDNLTACGQQGSKQLVKRVIGLPGDRVTVQNNTYVVYDKQHPNGFEPDKTLPYDADNHIPATTGTTNVTLGPDQLFVSGDNRPDSCDSRDFGPINTNDVIGQLVLRLLPINTVKVF